jgi:glyoxylase-like metal-dependent hydrolase (beta-lactamase superfamily II)
MVFITSSMKTWHTSSGYTVTRVLSGRSNVFLLTDSFKNILIDTSPGFRWKALKKNLSNLNIKKIDYLILTHTHFDHAANALKLKKEFGAFVIVNKREAECLQNGRSIIPQGTNYVTRFLVNKAGHFLSEKMDHEPCRPDIAVDQYYDMKGLGFNGYILFTPGHSPGSQSIIIDNQVALAGDSMFGIFPDSVFPPFADDEREMIKSWSTLIETGCEVFLPSHGTENSRDLLLKEYKKRSKS